jgi:hypothetical protein
MVGRCAASAIASASLQSFFCPFEYGRTCFAGISLTALDAIERRAVYSAAHKAKRREVAEMTDGCESDNKGTARSLPFAKVIEHDVLGGAEMGRQAWHGRRKMGTPNLMKTDAILAAWHRADGLRFNHSILVPAALPLQPKRDRP